jgi:hypothetical protein
MMKAAGATVVLFLQKCECRYDNNASYWKLCSTTVPSEREEFNNDTFTNWPLRRHSILCKSLRVISFRSWKWPLYASWRYCFCLSKICRNSTCCTLCLSTLCLLALWLSTLWFLALWLSRIQRNALDEKPAAGTLTHNQGDQIWVIVYAYFEQFFKVTKVAEICWAILSAVKVLYYLWQK